MPGLAAERSGPRRVHLTQVDEEKVVSGAVTAVATTLVSRPTM
jgi:hypothetical protein